MLRSSDDIRKDLLEITTGDGTEAIDYQDKHEWNNYAALSAEKFWNTRSNGKAANDSDA